MAPAALVNQPESSSSAPSTSLKMNGAHTNPSDFPLVPSTASPARPQEVLDAPLRTEFAFDPIEDAIAAFGRGEFLIVMDDEGRENEGDLIVAASATSTQKMAWMIKHTRYVSPHCTHPLLPTSPRPLSPHPAGTSASPSPPTASKRSRSP